MVGGIRVRARTNTGLGLRKYDLGLGLRLKSKSFGSGHTVIGVLFCSLAVLDPRVGHTMDVLSPFIPVLCHSD